MRSSDPHVSVVIYKSHETAQFLASFGFGYVHDSLYLIFHGLDSVSGNPISQVLELCSGEEGLLGVNLESRFLEPDKDVFQFFQMVIERFFRDGQ